MEVALEQLIERIKREGVQAAKKQAEEIISQAKSEAEKVLTDAHHREEAIIKNAQKQAADYELKARRALQQASRDVILLVRQKIIALIDETLKCDIQETLTPEFVCTLITKLIEQWKPEGTPVITVVLNDDDAQKLKKLLVSQLNEKLQKGIELKINNSITKGFQIGIKESQVYYDFSDESLLESLQALLNPALADVIAHGQTKTDG